MSGAGIITWRAFCFLREQLYAVIQIFEVEVILQDSPTGFKSSEILTILIPIVVCIAEVAYIGLAWKIYNEFGWQIFKLLGADRSIKRIYMQYQIFQCFMRFDAFFWIGFSIQVCFLSMLIVVEAFENADVYLTLSICTADCTDPAKGGF
jgi:hypothetical protein